MMTRRIRRVKNSAVDTAVGDLPEGLGVHADGEDVEGLQPWGHRSVYPTIGMSYDQFQELFQAMPWEYVGRIK
jgi:hypothetical protein